MFDANDIKIVRGPGSNDQARTESSTSLNAGEPIKRGGTGSNFAVKVADGDPEIGTDTLLGVSEGSSTDTSSAKGVVDYFQVQPGAVLRGAANNSANIDSDSKLEGVELDQVTFDVNSGTVTIDEDEGSDPNVHGLCILTGDIVKGTLDVAVHANVTLFGSLVGQTMD